MNYPVICTQCGTTGTFGRITASLSCPNCKTGEHLDLNEKVAADQSEQSAGGNGATGWGRTQPNRLEGWDEYTGPTPAGNPLAGEHMVGDLDAYNDGDWQRGNPGYIPGGGYDNAPRHLGPTTGVPPIESWDEHRGPESGGARWQGGKTSAVSMVPLVVTLPNGTKWEGTGRVIAAKTSPKKAAAKPAPKKVDRLGQITAKIRQANTGLSEVEARALAERALNQWGDE